MASHAGAAWLTRLSAQILLWVTCQKLSTNCTLMMVSTTVHWLLKRSFQVSHDLIKSFCSPGYSLSTVVGNIDSVTYTDNNKAILLQFETASALVRHYSKFLQDRRDSVCCLLYESRIVIAEALKCWNLERIIEAKLLHMPEPDKIAMAQFTSEQDKE